MNMMRLQFLRLQERQTQELVIAEDHHRQLIENCIEMKDKEINALGLAIQQLEIKRSGPKPKLIGPFIIRPRSATNLRPTSPNTKKTLSAYRTSEDQGRLYLAPFNVSESLQPCALSTSPPVRLRTTRRYRSLRI
jgi:hypothetical protein